MKMMDYETKELLNTIITYLKAISEKTDYIHGVATATNNDIYEIKNTVAKIEWKVE
jgi:hypothetical protein